MNLLFTLSFSQEIGSGHLYRVQSLYAESKTFNPSIAIQRNSKDEKFLATILKGSNTFFYTDFCSSEFQELIKEGKYNIVVTDLLIEDYNKIAFLKREMVFRLISILSYEKEIKQIENSYCIIFPSPFKLKNKSKIKFYSGPEVLFLNRALIENYYTFRNEVKNILVFFGGTDPENIINKVYLCLKNKALTTYNFTIISNADFPSTENINIIKPGPNYLQVVLDSDLAIINGGNTRYEMSYIGLPTIAISIHKEQYQITQKTTGINSMINLGIYKDLNCKQITDCIIEKSIDLSWRSTFYHKSTQYFKDIKNAYKNFNQILLDEKNYFL